jgi:hypothetical protein
MEFSIMKVQDAAQAVIRYLDGILDIKNEDLKGITTHFLVF